MKLEHFQDDLFNKDHYIVFVKIVNLKEKQYLMVMQIEIRYIFIFNEIKIISQEDIKKKVDSCIKNISYKSKIKLLYSKNDKVFEGLNDQNSLKFYDNKIDILVNRNIRTIIELLEKKNIILENLTDGFNKKNIKTLLKKTPSFWLNKLNTRNKKIDSDEANSKSNNIEGTTVEVINPSNINNKSNNDLKSNLTILNSNEFNKINLYRYVTNKYNDDWFSFFFDLKKIFFNEIKNLKNINNTLDKVNNNLKLNNEIIVENNNNLKLNNKILKETKNKLLNDNQELNQKLEFVKKEIEFQQKLRKEKEEKANKVKNAKKQPKRDYIEYGEFNYLLNLCGSDTIFDTRKRCAFLLLYFTGLRVSNLLNLKIKNIKGLLYNGYTRVDLIKKGEIEHLITLSNESKKILNNHYNCFHKLYKYKVDEDFFFTSVYDTKKPIHRSNFNKELNDILKIASKELNKNIKTHSFRTTYITDLLEIAPLHVVKDIIGHKVVASTEIYYRSSLTHKKSLDILNKADHYRFK